MPKTIRLKYVPGGKDWKFDLYLEAFNKGEDVILEVCEIDTDIDYDQHEPRVIGTIKGQVQQSGKNPADQILTNTAATNTTSASPRILFVTDQKSGSKEYGFNPAGTGEADEGDSWEIQIRVKGQKEIQSQTWLVPRYSRALPSTQSTYYPHPGNKVVLYNDGSTDKNGGGGAFCDLNAVIDAAQYFIFIADWSFHPYMRLRHSSKETVGQKLIEWAKKPAPENKTRIVAIHTWDHTNIAAPDDQNDEGGTIFQKELNAPSNLFWRMSSRTGEDGGSGFGWSHHQKFVVLDAPCEEDQKKRRTIRAFLGGLDLAQGRFDWPKHLIMTGELESEEHMKITQFPREVHDWYNCEFESKPDLAISYGIVHPDKAFPRQPWHDVHCQVVGPAAWDIVREFVGRWNVNPSWSFPGTGFDPKRVETVLQIFQTTLFDKNLFIQQWERVKDSDHIWNGQVYRSITSDHWGPGKAKEVKTPARHVKGKTEFTWSISDSKREHSIQDAYLKMIGEAERFIYIETQYFIGSGSQWKFSSHGGVKNKLPEAIADRILQKVSAKEDFHVYLIVPMFPEGSPSASSNQAQRDYQWQSIAYIVRRLAQDQNIKYWRNYLTVGFLANWCEVSKIVKSDSIWNKDATNRLIQVRENQRYMIYVHTKMMIVDDRYIIVGSANLNERSLAGGRDSEICIGLWPELTQQKACINKIQDLRRRLWEEHFKVLPSGWKDHPENYACYHEIQQIGDDNNALLEAGKHKMGNKTKKGHFCCWDIDGSKDGLGLRGEEKYIIDGLAGKIIGDDWYIWPTGYMGSFDLAE